MKTFFLVFFLLLAFNFVSSTTQSFTLTSLEEQPEETPSSQIDPNVFVPVKNLNFDIRENNIAIHKPIEMGDILTQTQQLTCNSNVPLQISSVLSDKIFPLDKTKVISPMNSITCFREGFVCLKSYTELDELKTDMQLLVDLYNKKGAQFLTSYPYSFESSTGKFPECKVFKNEIEFFDQKSIKYAELTTDFEQLKRVIFNKGPILCAFYATSSFIGNYIKGGIYVPDDSKPKTTYYLLRIVGWRTLGEKRYWVFAFTRDDNWGIKNFGMIDVDTPGLLYFDIVVAQ